MGGTLACGMCVDTGLIQGIPFSLPWVVLLLGWSIFAGLPLHFMARSRGHVLPLRPLRFLLLAVILVLTLGLFAGGSVVMPGFLAAAASLFHVSRDLLRARKANEAPDATATLARRWQGLYLAACVGIVPVALLKVLLRGA